MRLRLISPPAQLAISYAPTTRKACDQHAICTSGEACTVRARKPCATAVTPIRAWSALYCEKSVLLPDGVSQPEIVLVLLSSFW